MAKVAPTITAETPDRYKEQIERVKPFAKRLHVDVADGVFAPTKLVGLAQAYGIEGVELDLHLMLKAPEADFENSVSLEPKLVILHAESDGDIKSLINRYRELGIRVGLAVLRETKVAQVKDLLPEVDHFLVFTGKLGYQGGEMDASILEKISRAKAINPKLEVGVDGGVSLENCRQVLAAGADVLDVGSAIQTAADPEATYIGIESIATGEVS